MRRFFLLAALAWLLSAAPAALAQCSMCATGASAAGQRAQKSLKQGVVVLLVPPIALMAGLVGLAFFYRRDG
jgi:hypothetical protein